MHLAWRLWREAQLLEAGGVGHLEGYARRLERRLARREVGLQVGGQLRLLGDELLKLLEAHLLDELRRAALELSDNTLLQALLQRRELLALLLDELRQLELVLVLLLLVVEARLAAVRELHVQVAVARDRRAVHVQ